MERLRERDLDFDLRPRERERERERLGMVKGFLLFLKDHLFFSSDQLRERRKKVGKKDATV
jgi:hypothetical protein